MDKSNAKKIDVEALMAQIRTEVQQDIDQGSENNGHLAALNTGEQLSSSSLLYSEELNYLNREWNLLASRSQFSSHRPWLGPIIVRLKRLTSGFVWNFLLRDYFEAERRFHMNLVKHLNANARYTDQRIKEVFWQLVEKVDLDIKGLNERTDNLVSVTERTFSEKDQLLSSRLSSLQSGVEILQSFFDDGSIAKLNLSEKTTKKLLPLTDSEHLPPPWRKSLAEVNQLITSLNELLSSQQY